MRTDSWVLFYRVVNGEIFMGVTDTHILDTRGHWTTRLRWETWERMCLCWCLQGNGVRFSHDGLIWAYLQWISTAFEEVVLSFMHEQSRKKTWKIR